jgi:hypothetical protein
LVADLCFGSGTTLEAAARLGRRFLGVDRGGSAHATARKRLLGWAVEQRLHPNVSETRMRAQLMTAIGFYEVTLIGCEPDEQLRALALNPPLQGFDAIDQWSAGFLRGDMFVGTVHAARTATHPALPTTLEMPMLSGEPALCTVDILGRRQVYVWEDQHA